MWRRGQATSRLWPASCGTATPRWSRKNSRRRGKSPLFYACMFGHLDVAQWLVKQGAGVNTETSDKYTPLAISVAKACESNDPRHLALIK